MERTTAHQAAKLAKSFVAACVAEASGRGEGLIGEIEHALVSMTSSDFDQTLVATLDLAEMRPDGPEIADVICTDIEELCEVVELDDGRPECGFLMAVPLLITAGVPSVEIELDGDQQQEVAKVLRESGVLHSEAGVEFFPRILSAAQVGAMKHGDVYRLARLMSLRKFAEIDAFVESLSPTVANALTVSMTADSTSVHSTGLLVGFVLSQENDPFTLAADFYAEARDAEADGIFDALAEAAESSLLAAGVAIATIIGAELIEISSPPTGWFMGADAVQRAQRDCCAAALLAKAVDEHGSMDGLYAVIVDSMHHGAFQEKGILVVRRRDHATVQSIAWPAMHAEPVLDYDGSLCSFLSECGIAALDDEDDEEDDDGVHIEVVQSTSRGPSAYRVLH